MHATLQMTRHHIVDPTPTSCTLPSTMTLHHIVDPTPTSCTLPSTMTRRRIVDPTPTSCTLPSTTTLHHIVDPTPTSCTLPSTMTLHHIVDPTPTSCTLPSTMTLHHIWVCHLFWMPLSSAPQKLDHNTIHITRQTEVLITITTKMNTASERGTVIRPVFGGDESTSHMYMYGLKKCTCIHSLSGAKSLVKTIACAV